MLQALIVDENLKSLQNFVDWNCFGVNRIEQAESDKQGMNLFMEEHPNIVIVDMQIPDQGGLAFLRTIKEIDSETVVILMSQFMDFENAQQALNLGAADYLVKPVAEAELRGALSRVLARMSIAGR